MEGLHKPWQQMVENWESISQCYYTPRWTLDKGVSCHCLPRAELGSGLIVAGHPAIAWPGLRAEEAGGGVPGLQQAHGKCRSGNCMWIALFLGNRLLLLLLQGLWSSHQANKVEGASSSKQTPSLLKHEAPIFLFSAYPHHSRPLQRVKCDLCHQREYGE